MGQKNTSIIWSRVKKPSISVSNEFLIKYIPEKASETWKRLVKEGMLLKSPLLWRITNPRYCTKEWLDILKVSYESGNAVFVSEDHTFVYYTQRLPFDDWIKTPNVYLYFLLDKERLAKLKESVTKEISRREDEMKKRKETIEDEAEKELQKMKICSLSEKEAENDVS